MPNYENNKVKGSLWITFSVRFPEVELLAEEKDALRAVLAPHEEASTQATHAEAPSSPKPASADTGSDSGGSNATQKLRYAFNGLAFSRPPTGSLD
jgi:DnaJ-class molecular chaperone